MSVHDFKVSADIKTTAKRKKSILFPCLMQCVCYFCFIYEYEKCARRSLWQFSIKRYLHRLFAFASVTNELTAYDKQVPHDRILINVCKYFFFFFFLNPIWNSSARQMCVRGMRVISMHVGTAARVSQRWCSGTEQHSGKTLRAGKPSAHRSGRTLGAVWTVSCDDEKKAPLVSRQIFFRSCLRFDPWCPFLVSLFFCLHLEPIKFSVICTREHRGPKPVSAILWRMDTTQLLNITLKTKTGAQRCQIKSRLASLEELCWFKAH